MTPTDLFLALLKYFRTGDNDSIPEQIITKANEQYTIAEDYISRNIDLSSFIAYDYINVQKFLTDWYAASRTIIDIHKTITDVYASDDDQLNLWAESFGFIYPDMIPTSSKPTFLLELVNLYKIKGSPESLLKLVQFLNYTDFKVFEYWLVADQNAYDLIYDDGFIYDKIPPRHLMFLGKQIGRMLEQKETTLKYKYDQFHAKDAHWYLSKQDIAEKTEDPISLPSLTPYFGLFNTQYCTSKWLPTIAYISRVVYKAYEDYKNNNVNPRTIIVDKYNNTISLLELHLGMSWLFFVKIGYINRDLNTIDPNAWNSIDDDNLRYIGYSVDIANEIDVAQFKDDYERLFLKAPPSRDALYAYIKERSEKFTFPTNHPLFNSASDIGPLLKELNPDFYNFLYVCADNPDEYIDEILNIFWKCFDNIVGALDLALATFDNVLVFEGVQIYTIINFFKPIYSRLANLAFMLTMGDQVGDRILIDEQNKMKIDLILDSKLYTNRCLHYDCHCTYYDQWLRYLLCDRTSINITLDPAKDDFKNDDKTKYKITNKINDLASDKTDSAKISRVTQLQRDSTRPISPLGYDYDAGLDYDTSGSIIYDSLDVIIL